MERRQYPILSNATTEKSQNEGMFVFKYITVKLGSQYGCCMEWSG